MSDYEVKGEGVYINFNEDTECKKYVGVFLISLLFWFCVSVFWKKLFEHLKTLSYMRRSSEERWLMLSDYIGNTHHILTLGWILILNITP